MELYGGVYFFVCAVIIAIPAIVLGVFEKNIKYYGMIATIFFIWMSMGANLRAILFLIIYCILEFVMAKTFLICKRNFGRNQFIYWTYLFLSLAPLIICKISGIFDMHIFAFLGISYMTFKSVQIIIEIFDELIDDIKLFDFLYFLLFFPTLSSGPIDRSRRFNNDIIESMQKNVYIDLLGKGILKICLGVLYKFVIASIFFQIETTYGMDYTITSCLIYMYSYGFYLFFDFAGYSMMAIGMSYIFGVKTPINFNKPFISRDIIEFWDRWHITLSHWFRDFVFSRIMMRAIKGKWFKSKLTRASFGFIVNMTIMGIWHGLGIQYILYGLYHGILLALTEIYQKKFQFHKKHKKEKVYQIVCWFITFNLVMFGFYIFSGRFTFLLDKVITAVL